MSWLPDWLTGFNRDNYNAGLEADRQLGILNAQTAHDYRNKYGDDFADEWEAEVAKNQAIAGGQYAAPDEQIEGAFWEGWNEGGDKIRNGIGGTINTATGSLFRIVPWQVWVIGLGFAAYKLGLFKGLMKKSA